MDSLFMIAPQYVMYNLLRLLEARDAGHNIAAEGRFWVLTLGVVIIVDGFINNWMWWVAYSLNISVRAQLGGLIFDKSTRRKDIKGVVDREEDAAVGIDMEEADHSHPQAQPEKADVPSAEEIEEGINKTRQGV